MNANNGRADNPVAGLRDAGVVITGAGSGIGAALARRFAEAGARVVVNDRHPDRAAAVAAEIGGMMLPGDAADRLVPAARELLGGTVDVYCANAGYLRAGGPEVTDDDWTTSWAVNVMAHVRAARDLLPEWLDRGQGRFVSVTSAAALLTLIGSAPYAVSKHAALAFAEWMSLTYRHRGVHVHAICPRGVRTELREASVASTALSPNSTAIDPEKVADALFAGIMAGQFLILPHPEVADQAAKRITDHERWLSDVNRMQRSTFQ